MNPEEPMHCHASQESKLYSPGQLVYIKCTYLWFGLSPFLCIGELPASVCVEKLNLTTLCTYMICAFLKNTSLYEIGVILCEEKATPTVSRCVFCYRPT